MQNAVVTTLRIFSGGQTGVDRAALDIALELGLEHGGWCPLGRRAEDGSIHPRYHLRETAEKDYSVRTRRNVESTDGTLILYKCELEGGSEYTAHCAGQLHKPLLLIDLDHPPAAATFNDWLARNNISTLNVAGPRESKYPGIYRQAAALLRELLAG